MRASWRPAPDVPTGRARGCKRRLVITARRRERSTARRGVIRSRRERPVTPPGRTAGRSLKHRTRGVRCPRTTGIIPARRVLDRRFAASASVLERSPARANGGVLDRRPSDKRTLGSIRRSHGDGSGSHLRCEWVAAPLRSRAADEPSAVLNEQQVRWVARVDEHSAHTGLQMSVLESDAMPTGRPTLHWGSRREERQCRGRSAGRLPRFTHPGGLSRVAVRHPRGTHPHALVDRLTGVLHLRGPGASLGRRRCVGLSVAAEQAPCARRGSRRPSGFRRFRPLRRNPRGGVSSNRGDNPGRPRHGTPAIERLQSDQRPRADLYCSTTACGIRPREGTAMPLLPAHSRSCARS